MGLQLDGLSPDSKLREVMGMLEVLIRGDFEASDDPRQAPLAKILSLPPLSTSDSELEEKFGDLIKSGFEKLLDAAFESCANHPRETIRDLGKLLCILSAVRMPSEVKDYEDSALYIKLRLLNQDSEINNLLEKLTTNVTISLVSLSLSLMPETSDCSLSNPLSHLMKAIVLYGPLEADLSRVATGLLENHEYSSSNSHVWHYLACLFCRSVVNEDLDAKVEGMLLREEERIRSFPGELAGVHPRECAIASVQGLERFSDTLASLAANGRIVESTRVAAIQAIADSATSDHVFEVFERIMRDREGSGRLEYAAANKAAGILSASEGNDRSAFWRVVYMYCHTHIASPETFELVKALYLHSLPSVQGLARKIVSGEDLGRALLGPCLLGEDSEERVVEILSAAITLIRELSQDHRELISSALSVLSNRQPSC